MKVGTETVSVEALRPKLDTYGELVYLVDSDPDVLSQKYHELNRDKKIIAAYGLNGRHYLAVYVDGIRKRINKKGQ